MLETMEQVLSQSEQNWTSSEGFTLARHTCMHSLRREQDAAPLLWIAIISVDPFDGTCQYLSGFIWLPVNACLVQTVEILKGCHKST